MQKQLNAQQVAAFYHDLAVPLQVSHFHKLCSSQRNTKGTVVDVGGGIGLFAQAIKKEMDLSVRLIDLDPISVEHARSLGITADIGDATKPNRQPDDEIICFNLILHHLVSTNESSTLGLQCQALKVWQSPGVLIFINEYIYESWFGNASGWLIFNITKNKFLSAIGRFVSKFIPSLHANTFGVGVRFRSNSEWRKVFDEIGFELLDQARGEQENISFARRLLLIKEIRRDSFLLAQKKGLSKSNSI